MKGVDRRWAGDDLEDWGPSLQLGAASALDGDGAMVVLLDHRGEPFPQPPKLIGYERRECIES